MLFAAIAVASTAAPEASGSWTAELESGAVWSGSNDVRIPGKGGTLLSLSEDLSTESGPYWRARLGWNPDGRHHLRALWAPLELRANGAVDRPVRFQGTEFPAGADLEARYRFDSYRLTYRYDLHASARGLVGLGFTAKIRDAEVSLSGEGLSARKTNTGFVPLLHFLGEWRWHPRWSVLLDADALAAPQGRAEDVLFALRRDFGRSVTLTGGYRFVEGGADNDEVYSFAWIHYASLALGVSF